MPMWSKARPFASHNFLAGRSAPDYGSAIGTCKAGTPGPARSPGPTPVSTPSDAAPDRQQQLALNLAAEPQFLDPQKSSLPADVAVEHLLWRGLFDYDASGNTMPDLAAELPAREN